MASVTPDLGLIRSVLGAFADADVDQASPITILWRRLTDRLTAGEASQLPNSIAAVTPLLMKNPDRLRLAIDLAATFDLIEVLPSLLKVVAETHSADAALASAWLATNPGVDPELVAAVQRAAENARLSERQRLALTIRMSPGAAISDSLAAGLQSQVWPGLGLSHASSAPPVVIDESAGPANVRLKLAGDLHEAGATIRRLPAVWVRKPEPAWLGPNVVVVTWTEATVSRLREIDQRMTVGQFVLGPSIDSLRARRRTLAEVSARLPGGSTLRFSSQEELELSADPLRPELYKLGAFDVREMLFLSGVAYSTLQRVREDLAPRESNGSPFWSFNQLMALRTWQVFRLRSGKRNFRTDVLRSLSEFAGAAETTRIGVTSVGEILLEDRGRLISVTSGQEAIPDFIYLDEVFEPVPFGQGQVPGLLDPSAHTRVNPSVLGGTPRLEGQRIPARTLAKMAEEHGLSSVVSAYPSIDESHILDGIRLGGELLRAA
jgi:uncharacterized protein (DUF433 family)